MKETPRAKRAWADYLAMGPGRSLEKLLDRYLSATESPPTRRIKTLKDWSVAYAWQARLSAIADQQAREAEEREAAYRREIMEEGYGLAHERVKALKQLAVLLNAELLDETHRWLTDKKALGSGKSMEIVDTERFNHHEVEQLRGLLDDIAREKGDRKETKILAGDKERPITFIEVGDAVTEGDTRG